MPFLIPRPGNQQLPAPSVSLGPDAMPAIRPAKVADVHGMSAIINQYATANVMLARGPQYLYQHIQDYVVAVWPDAEGREIVIGCGAVHVIWEDLAEIRSVAVHLDCKNKGLGSKLINSLLDRCRYLGIPKAFVFTLVADFFRNCGFAEVERDQLPPAVWVECSKCPKFYRCDEICMLRSIDLIPAAADASVV